MGARDIRRFSEIVGTAQVEQAEAVARALSAQLGERVIWNVSSTAVGGGVAEMLQPLLGYARGLGFDARWVVIRGNDDFFRITKRIHHALHGAPGDGSVLGPADRSLYESTLAANAHDLCGAVQPGDVVILHDPQTAGLAPAVHAAGALVIWRCHIGHDHRNQEVEAGWQFLAPYLKDVPAYVFSREAYIPEVCDPSRAEIIQPSIDAFSSKNQELSDEVVRTILVHTGLVEGPLPQRPDHSFLRGDGSRGRVQRRADVIRLGPAPAYDVPLVVQVSRWDPLKDMLGVMRGFAALFDGASARSAALVLAGPNVHAVADDPEGPAVFDEVLQAWRNLPHSVRQRVHLANLPTADVEENAAIVNALQRHASIVVQKSLNEGFGLTVTEAMWKARPVIASAVGGIQDQIEDGISGVLLADPRDLNAFGSAVAGLLADPEAARRMGDAAKERVRANFLGVAHLIRYGDLIQRIGARVSVQ